MIEVESKIKVCRENLEEDELFLILKSHKTQAEQLYITIENITVRVLVKDLKNAIENAINIK